MANRSYIYALNENEHISLGEFNYFIPYAYRILAAFDNKTVDSHLFDKFVGIEADFKKGREILYVFLDLLASTGQMKNQEEFNELVKTTKEFLDPVEASSILLENGEIYALYTDKEGNYLDGPGLEEANGYAQQDYQWIGEDIENLLSLNLNPAYLFHYTDESYLELYQWVIDLKDNWEEQLGINSWSSILYFQFNPKSE